MRKGGRDIGLRGDSMRFSSLISICAGRYLGGCALRGSPRVEAGRLADEMSVDVARGTLRDGPGGVSGWWRGLLAGDDLGCAGPAFDLVAADEVDGLLDFAFAQPELRPVLVVAGVHRINRQRCVQVEGSDAVDAV
jgi:hypothetical protein